MRPNRAARPGSGVFFYFASFLCRLFPARTSLTTPAAGFALECGADHSNLHGPPRDGDNPPRRFFLSGASARTCVLELADVSRRLLSRERMSVGQKRDRPNVPCGPGSQASNRASGRRKRSRVSERMPQKFARRGSQNAGAEVTVHQLRAKTICPLVCVTAHEASVVCRGRAC